MFCLIGSGLVPAVSIIAHNAGRAISTGHYQPSRSAWAAMVRQCSAISRKAARASESRALSADSSAFFARRLKSSLFTDMRAPTSTGRGRLTAGNSRGQLQQFGGNLSLGAARLLTWHVSRLFQTAHSLAKAFVGLKFLGGHWRPLSLLSDIRDYPTSFGRPVQNCAPLTCHGGARWIPTPAPKFRG